MEYLKKDYESDFDYIIRLVEGKNNGTYDIDYTELFKLAFGVEFSSDHCRKMYYALRMLLPYLEGEKTKNITSSEILTELDIKRLELQKEKIKVQTLRLDLNKNIRISSRKDLLVEEFINELKEQRELPYPEFKELKKQDDKRSYILSFADSHFGKEFKSITNQYDLQTIYTRFETLFNEILEIIEENNIKHITILALGDLIEGMCLRISQLDSLRIGMIKQCIEFMRFLVAWLNKLSEYVEITYYQAPYANHSQIRPFSSKSTDFVNEDVEKLIFVYIHDMLQSNSRICVKECSTKYVIFKIFNYNIIAGHGHDIKNANNFIKDASEKYRIFFDYAFFAHKHHTSIKTVGEGSSNNCEIIGTPSIMGSDEYSDGLFTGSKAGAILIEFTEKQGKRKTYDIILN